MPYATFTPADSNAAVVAAYALLARVTEDEVLTAYNGARGCMCGCLGDYAVSETLRAEAAANRGYDYDDSEVSMRKVRGRLNKVKRDLRDESYDEFTLCTNDAGEVEFFGVELNGRVTVVYLSTEATRAKLARKTEAA